MSPSAVPDVAARRSTLQRLVLRSQEAVRELGGRADDLTVEGWATAVHEAMASGARSFHDIGHVFEITAGKNATQFLAGMFHDTVYLQVDGGLTPRLQRLLGDAFVPEGAGVRLQLEQDPWKLRLGRLFGVEHGQVLSHLGGANELLSALLAVRLLHGVLSHEDCLRVAAAIEMTIPFRPVVKGASAAERLHARLQTLADEEGLSLDTEDAVRDAVDLANTDVGNFAWSDAGRFLDNTWKLLPESNAGLRARVYTIEQYRQAMAKMRGFFGFVDPSTVFSSFAGAPSPEELAALREAAARNLRLGHRYLGAKLLAATLLAALAERTGGDAPISLFMGDLPSVCIDSPRLEEHLPTPAPAPDADPEVLRLLVEGRASESGFDLHNAPLAGYLYAAVGERTGELLEQAAERGADALLDALPHEVLEPVVSRCAELAITRSSALRALL